MSRTTRSRAATRLAMLAGAVGVASALLLAGQGPPLPAPPPSGASPAAVPLTPMPSGTGTIAGRVVATDSSQPVGRAIVKLGLNATTLSRSVISDAAGRFAFDHLPPGRFTLTASKPSYITTAYGATQPGRPGTPVTVATGQAVSDIEVHLARGAVLAGRVTDERGEPMAGLLVAYLRASDTAAAAPLTGLAAVTGEFTTDDRGQFRIYGLPPGTYLVAAGPRSTGNAPVGMMPTGEVDVALAELERSQGRGARGDSGARIAPPSIVQFVSVYYPGTPDVGLATPITVRAGEERADLDIRFSAVPSASIEGTVTAPATNTRAIAMSLAPVVPSRLPSFLVNNPSLAVRPGADGRFRFTGVPPGRYLLAARTEPSSGTSMTTTFGSGGSTTFSSTTAAAPPRATGESLFASTELMVQGLDVTGVALDLHPAPHVSGRVVFDAARETPPVDASSIRITLLATHPVQATGAARGSTTSLFAFNTRAITTASAGADGQFDIGGVVPDSYEVTATPPAAAAGTWRLRSAMIGGSDVLDTGLVVRDSGFSDAVLTFTDRHTELTGTLQSTGGTPAPDYFVVAFTRDRALWKPQGRRLLMTRPATDGTFSIKDLPPGDYYLAALTDLDPNDWQTPEFLGQLVPASLTITIGEGEQKQDIRLK